MTDAQTLREAAKWLDTISMLARMAVEDDGMVRVVEGLIPSAEIRERIVSIADVLEQAEVNVVGHKAFVLGTGDDLCIEMVNDERSLIRMRLPLGRDEARALAHDLIEASANE